MSPAPYVRPSAKPYLALYAVAIAAWAGWLLWVLHDNPAPDAAWAWLATAVGAAALALLGGGVYGAHAAVRWCMTRLHQADVPSPAPGPMVGMPPAGTNTGADQLYLRSLGCSVGGLEGAALWKHLEIPPDGNDPLLEGDTGRDPVIPRTLAGMGMWSQANMALAMEGGVRHAVPGWPIPVFTLSPTMTDTSRFKPEDWLGIARAQLDQPEYLLLRQASIGSNDAGDLWEQVFAFFDAHPDMPGALVVAVDGPLVRGHYPPTGEVAEPTPGELQDAAVALWLSPRLRVPAARRADVARDDMAASGQKLLQALYAEQDQGESMEEVHPDHYTPPTAAWQAQLPDLHAQGDRRGTGDAAVDAWWPVRWSQYQVDTFDAAPVLATVHRPVVVDAGARDVEKTLKLAWEAAAARANGPIVRWFQHGEATSERAALRFVAVAEGEGGHSALPEVDTRKRVGNMGAPAALVGTALAAQAGGASMLAWSSSDGRLLLQAISSCGGEQGGMDAAPSP